MPRFKSMKTKKAARKRFKITATGKVTHYRAGRRHLLGHKAAKRKRFLSKEGTLSETHVHHIKNALPFDHRG
jgi:large subunit ribosomal protein L35